MNPILSTDFVIDEQSFSIRVSRGFQAPVARLWDTWTQPALLDQWWAPRPYVNRTKQMDLRAGGHWLYSMTSPAGESHWCRADYEAVSEGQQIVWIDAFCDEDGRPNGQFPAAHWTVDFRAEGQGSRVEILLRYKSLEHMQQIIGMGFREGFGMAMQNLDEVLAG